MRVFIGIIWLRLEGSVLATADRSTVVPFLRLRRLACRRQGRGTRLVRSLCVPLVATAAIVLLHPTAAAPTQEVRRILILNEINPSYPASTIIHQGIQAGMNDSPHHLDFYSEYMDTALFPEPPVQQ